MKCLSYGGGVNSTAILALIAQGKITGIERAVFCDTGAENPGTYDYLEYIRERSPISIDTIKSKEGSLFEFCERKVILPARYMRWCTDRFKRRPLEQYAKQQGITEWVIGIDAGERKRVNRWKSREGYEFPLISLGLNRQSCEEAIIAQGWKTPHKSGCVFCPFSKTKDFAELKVQYPEIFARICELEKKAIEHLGTKGNGWFGAYLLPELIERKHPATNKGQTCLFCMEWC
jgi:hypothetical protein